MKRVLLMLCALLVIAGVMQLTAQTRPVMTNMVFINNDGNVITKTGLGRVVVEITFSTAMDQDVEPAICLAGGREYHHEFAFDR